MTLDELPEIDRRALALLRSPMSCATLGSELWGQAKGSSSCPYARPAGKVVSRLRALRLVERNSFDDNKWRASREGLRLLVSA